MKDPSNERDLETWQLIKDSPNEGLTRLLDDHGGNAAEYLQKKLGKLLGTEERESLLIDGAYRVLDTIYEFDPARSSLATWFTLLTYRRAVDYLRGERRHRERHTSDVNELAVEDVAHGQQFTLAMNEVYDAIEQLPKRCKRVIEADLVSGDSRSTKEKAEDLGISVEAYYKYRSEGLKLLQGRLTNDQ